MSLPGGVTELTSIAPLAHGARMAANVRRPRWLAVSVLVAWALTQPCGAGGLTATDAASRGPALAMILLAQDDSLDDQIRGATTGLFRELRRAWRTATWMFGRAFDWWGGWLKRGAFSVAVALVAALADSGLVNAWRLAGLRALATYVPLTLYVYGRLLFSSGVTLAPKLLLLAALLYGAVRRDLIPDRSMVPGRIEDIVLIIIATRAFVYACPEALVEEYADRAVMLRRAGVSRRLRRRGRAAAGQPRRPAGAHRAAGDRHARVPSWRCCYRARAAGPHTPGLPSAWHPS